jgi:two-component system sensor histidine kinase/response regulator
MIHQLKLLFIASHIDDPLIGREVRKANLMRCIITACGAIIFSAAVISVFSQSTIHGKAIEAHWRMYVIQLNIITISLNTLIAFMALYANRYKNADHRLYTYLPYALMAVIGAWGVVGTLFHQLISWNIAPFLLASFVLVMLLIKPKVLFYYFCLLYVGFYIFMPHYQSNPNYVLLNRILGFVTLFFSYFFSLLSWNNNLLRIRQNQLITLQAEALRESNASKDKFFSILSHDLKAPVATSLLLTEMLQEEQVGEQERQEIQALFRSSLQNISRLLNNVLLWANNQSGKINFHPVPLELRTLIQEDMELLHAMAINKQISLVNDVPADFLIHADQDMMHTIVRNILTNAIKFTHKKGNVTVIAEELKANTVIPVDHVKISILDNGIGISAALLEDLFKLDKKIMTPGTNNETGTGLGLILCKDFIEKHEGKLLVESEVGKGSCFVCVIPLLK